MNYLHTKYEHYSIFVDKYQTDRLEKGLKIYTISKSKLFNRFLNEEIFNFELYTDYKIEKIDNDILISFYTKSKNKYRLDIIRGIEKDKSDELINHISFSEYSSNPNDEDEYETLFSEYSSNSNDEDEYETLLNRNKMIEIINRIHFILKDLIKNNIIYNYFCIGGTKLLSKNNIYRYVLKMLVGDDGFEKLDTDVYKSGYGLYFKIN